MSDTNSPPVGLGTGSLALAFNTSLGNDLTAAGSDFGRLIQGVGAAVAATSVTLALTSAATASTLAKTLVDVIAVQATNFNDDGVATASSSFVRRLPLIDFIDPAFYQWTQVRLQGQFFVNELASATTSTSSTFSSQDNSGQHGLFVFLGGGQTGTGFQTTDTTRNTQSDTAVAVGRARMFAQLNPRTDTGVPRPTKVIQGPTVQIVEGDIVNTPPTGSPLVTRTMSLLLILTAFNGAPIANKAISIETDGVPWEFATAGATTTDVSGHLAIRLRRNFLPVPAGAPPGTTQNTSAIEVVVTARLGLVSTSVTVRV